MGDDIFPALDFADLPSCGATPNVEPPVVGLYAATPSVHGVPPEPRGI
jgi:hypothetical protein